MDWRELELFLIIFLGETINGTIMSCLQSMTLLEKNKFPIF